MCQVAEWRGTAGGIGVVINALPEQAVRGEAADARRIQTPSAERLDHRDSIAAIVVLDQLGVGRDQGPEVFAESQVDRRTVIQGPDAHGQDVLGRLRCFPGKPGDEVGVELTRGQNATSAGGDPQEIGDPRLVDREECIENRRDQDRPARMGFHGRPIRGGVGGRRLPDARLFIDPAERIAECTVVADRLAELLSKLTQQVLRGEVASVLSDLVAENAGKAEVLHQGHDVGECFVEGQGVGVARLDESMVHPVEQRVGGLVGDDVVRQAGEYSPARQISARSLHRGREVAEKESPLLGTVVGVGLAEGMGVDPEPLDVLVRAAAPADLGWFPW